MRCWRIASRKWALDTRCEGARLHGGRWNPVGLPALYAGATIELCALEKFVHLAGVIHPPLVLVAIDIPDRLVPGRRIEPADLPPDWAELPIAAAAQAYGRQWLQAAQELALLLPSAIIPEATNLLVNPAHLAYDEVRLSAVRDFGFDARMFK